MSNSYPAYTENYINYIEEELKELDPNKPSDINKYAEVKSQKDVADIAKEYTEISWQADVIETIIAPVIGEINNYKYVDKNENKLADSTIKYNEMFKALKESNWKYFSNLNVTTSFCNSKLFNCNCKSTFSLSSSISNRY